VPRSTTSHDDDFAKYVERIVAEMPAEVPFDPHGPRPVNGPWYRTTPAVTAVGAIAAAVVLIGVSVFLLVYHRDSTERRESTPHSSPSPTPERSASPTPDIPSPPAPPSDTETLESTPPNSEEAPSASTQYVPPAGPPAPTSPPPNLSTQVTRPPEISVRPTHRPAFPGQS